MTVHIHITTPLWRGPRTGTARPAFGRGRYHGQLDGERRDLMCARSLCASVLRLLVEV